MTRWQQSSAAVYPAVNSWGDRALFWTVNWELFGEKQGSWLFDHAVRVRKDTSCPLAVFPLFHGRHFPGTALVFSRVSNKTISVPHLRKERKEKIHSGKKRRSAEENILFKVFSPRRKGVIWKKWSVEQTFFQKGLHCCLLPLLSHCYLALQFSFGFLVFISGSPASIEGL